MNIFPRVAAIASAAVLSLCLFGCGGSNNTATQDDDDTESKTSATSSYSSGKSSLSSGNSSHKPLNYGEREDGMTYSSTDDDGYSYYEYEDGSAEITDGYGNVGRDSDGDGDLDSFSSDGGETWEKF